MCDLSDFDPKHLLGINCTIYVRKLNRKKEWEPSEPIDIKSRAEQCYQSAFKDDLNQISVFSVSSNIELARIAVTMNAPEKRGWTEEIVLAWFTEEDIRSQNLIINQSLVETECELANRLHYDIEDDQYKVIALIESVMKIGRGIIRFKKAKMRKALKSAEDAGCYATDNPKVLKCECGF